MKLRRRETGEEFELHAGHLVGRLAECELRVEDASVSRRHARVESRAGEWWLVDLGSSNGTKRNGRPEREFAVRGGDLITFGVVAFDALGAARPSSSPPAAASAAAQDSGSAELATQERARLRAAIKGARRSTGFGDLGQQPLAVKLIAAILALGVLVGVSLGVRYLAQMM